MVPGLASSSRGYCTTYYSLFYVRHQTCFSGVILLALLLSREKTVYGGANNTKTKLPGHTSSGLEHDKGKTT